MIIQGIPAIILCIGLFFMPFSPRLLVNKGRDAEAIETLSYLRNLPENHYLVQVEYLEIKADAEFEKAIFDKQFPSLAASAGNSVWRREFAQYSNVFRTKDSFKRVATASLVMFFQQWTGIDASKFTFCFRERTVHTDVDSHLLCTKHLSIARSYKQHNLSTCHWCHWCHRRPHDNPSNVGH